MDANIAIPAALIADPVRATMLLALFDGRAQPASALARAAGISAQAASNHLARLLDGGMVTVEIAGRHRYYRLARPEIAAALESLACLAPKVQTIAQPLSREARRIRDARSCYDHLAGRLGVAVTVALEARGFLRDDGERGSMVTDTGKAWFADFGIDVATIKPRGRVLARHCLDWTERRHHLAGPLGTALLRRMLERDWLEREEIGRGLRLTVAGRLGLKEQLSVTLEPAAV